MTNRPRISLVCFAVNPGFADYVTGLITSIRSHAFVRVYIGSGLAPELSELVGSPYFRFGRTRHLPIDYIKYILSVLWDRPDLLLVQAWIKVPLLESLIIYLFRAVGIRCSVTIHDVVPHEPTLLNKTGLPFYYKSFTHLITHSNAARDRLRMMGIRHTIDVMPHPLIECYKLGKFTKQSARKKLNIPETNKFVVLFFGHITARKGIFQLVDAVRYLETSLEIKLVVAGASKLSSNELAQLERSCSQLDAVLVNRHIPHSEVELYFEAADCVAMPYLEGTTSGVLKIAMAFGKPVVASSIGDVAETVGAEAAVIVPLCDFAESFAAGILQAAKRIRSLEAGVQAARKKLGWATIGERYFRSLMDQINIKI